VYAFIGSPLPPYSVFKILLFFFGGIFRLGGFFFLSIVSSHLVAGLMALSFLQAVRFFADPVALFFYS